MGTAFLDRLQISSRAMRVSIWIIGMQQSYIRLNKDDFIPFIEDDETIDQYCQDMEKDGIWGDQLEMNALANAYKFNMIVHQVDHPNMV